jgi:hypothetical protein
MEPEYNCRCGGKLELLYEDDEDEFSFCCDTCDYVEVLYDEGEILSARKLFSMEVSYE